MRTLDILVVGLYMAALVGVGLRVSRRQTSTNEYFLADRVLPGWAIGMSLLATIITSVTFIAYPGAAYAGDWSLLVPGIMFVLVIAAIGFVVVPFFRHVVAMSVYEYFGKRFGHGQGDLEDSLNGKSRFRNESAERPALNELHGEKKIPVGLLH